MVEDVLEPRGQGVAVSENGCTLDENLTNPRLHRGNACDSTLEETNLSPIQRFYNGQSIFVTGGTGFMGKLLIEKLLRACPGISFIYLVVRPKKGKDVHQRMEELFNDPVFSKLKEMQPKFRDQIVAIAGDCGLPGLGMSAIDRQTVSREVSIVFHVAATVRFTETMKFAVAINVRGLEGMIELCKEISCLKSFVYLSTSYSNCPQEFIDEVVYDPPMDPNKLITLVECIDEKLVEEITPRLLGAWPNTYTFTKAVAESIVAKEAGQLPVGIFRPAIVISTYREPLRGWIDNLYGPMGIMVGVATGILTSIPCDGSKPANFVPGDLTVNALIACAWDVANQRTSAIIEEEGQDNQVPVYNYVSIDNPITYDQFADLCEKHRTEFPSVKAMWCYSFRNNKYKFIHVLCIYLLHLLPALFVDTVMLCLGKQPRMLKMYKKMHKYVDALQYFSITEWKFSNDNVKALQGKLTLEDRQNFACDMTEVNWHHYCWTYVRGIRIYLMKDSLDTLPQARVKRQRLYWIYQALKLILAYGLLRICWLTVSHLFWTSAL